MLVYSFLCSKARAHCRSVYWYVNDVHTAAEECPGHRHCLKETSTCPPLLTSRSLHRLAGQNCNDSPDAAVCSTNASSSLWCAHTPHALHAAARTARAAQQPCAPPRPPAPPSHPVPSRSPTRRAARGPRIASPPTRAKSQAAPARAAHRKPRPYGPRIASRSRTGRASQVAPARAAHRKSPRQRLPPPRLPPPRL